MPFRNWKSRIINRPIVKTNSNVIQHSTSTLEVWIGFFFFFNAKKKWEKLCRTCQTKNVNCQTIPLENRAITPHTTAMGALQKSPRTSSSVGKSSSTPGWPRRSRREDANVRAAAHANMEPHLCIQDCRTRERKGSGMDRTLALARVRHAVWLSNLSSGIREVASILCLRKLPILSVLWTLLQSAHVTVSYSLFSFHWHKHLDCSQLE